MTKTKSDFAAQLKALADEEVAALAPIRNEAETLAAENAAQLERIKALHQELTGIKADAARIAAAFDDVIKRAEATEPQTGAGQRAVADIVALRPASVAGQRGAGAVNPAVRAALRAQVAAIGERGALRQAEAEATAAQES